MSQVIERSATERSRRSILRLAVLSAVAAVPAVAALGSPRAATASEQCVQLLCECTGCLGGCYAGGLACKADCIDAHNGGYCWTICSSACRICSTGC